MTQKQLIPAIYNRTEPCSESCRHAFTRVSCNRANNLTKVW